MKKLIKTFHPDNYQKACVLVNQDSTTAPNIQEGMLKIYGVAPRLGKDLYPINDALREAVERVGTLEGIDQAY